jgi:hypothetical protein
MPSLNTVFIMSAPVAPKAMRTPMS